MNMFSRCRVAFFLLLASLFALLPLGSRAQVVKAEVNVDLRRLPLEKREKMVDFQDKITQYINQNTWCENRYGTELPIRIQIFLQDISVSYEDRYSGNFLISNTTDMQFYDKRWRFNYDRFESLVFDENLNHPLTSVIGFYIYILIGGEFDKFGKFEGSPYYEKALAINHQGRFSRFIWGWDERKIVIDDILDKKNQTYREAVDLFYLGLAYVKEDYSQTLKFCKGAVDLMAKQIEANPDYELPHQFIDGHYIDMIDIFKESEKYQSVFETLIKIDPDHEEEYKKHL